MTSRANPAAIQEIRQLSLETKGEIAHVFGNGLFIISATAQALLEHEDERVRSAARTIINATNELNSQQREMLASSPAASPDAHLGATKD